LIVAAIKTADQPACTDALLLLLLLFFVMCRVPLMIGSKKEVEYFESFYKN
jgi:hypothetical protein